MMLSTSCTATQQSQCLTLRAMLHLAWGPACLLLWAARCCSHSAQPQQLSHRTVLHLAGGPASACLAAAAACRPVPACHCLHREPCLRRHLPPASGQTLAAADLMPAGQLPKACLRCRQGLLSRPLPPQQAEGVRSELALALSAACRHAQKCHSMGRWRAASAPC